MAASDINIVLLGETGVGKSTFINALANYLKYNNLVDAKRKFVHLVPAKFEIVQPDFQSRAVCIGSDTNESSQAGHSSTQSPLIHNIPYKGNTLRIIDTPGLADTRGLARDQQNTKKLINFIGNLSHLNAICVVLKPCDSRLNVLFDFCIKNILSQLDRSARDNVIFVFTNARSSSYTPGDASRTLKTALSNVSSSGTILPFTKENTFCVDNEAFRYLVAHSQGVQFNPEDEHIYEQSWTRSQTECKRLLDHVLTLRPLSAQIVVTVRDAKAVMAKLAVPLIEMMILHERSIARIKTHQQDIEAHQSSMDDLKPRLYVPVIQYKTTKRVITDSKAGHKLQVGASLLRTIFGLDGKYKYQDTTKTHIEEYIEPYETKVEDSFVKNALLTESNRLAIVREKLQELTEMKEEYTEESKVIVESAAKFVAFLRDNAVVFSGDPFQQYIQQILDEERKCNGSPELISNLESLLLRYKLKKKDLSNVTSDDITNAITNLLRLKHAGPQFRQFYLELLD